MLTVTRADISALFPAKKEQAMRRLVVLVAAAVVMLALASPAKAQVITLRAELSGANETPAAVLTGAYGFAVVTVDLRTSSVSWVVDVFNMPSGTNNAHIHVGGPGLGGPTVINIPCPANISNDYRLTGSATTATAGLRPDQGIRSWEDMLQSIVGGQTYVNIHS